MENEHECIQEINSGVAPKLPVKRDHTIAASILISSIILAGTWIYTSAINAGARQAATAAVSSELQKKVLPSGGVILPVTWGDLGAKMVNAGVIDATKFEAIYQQRGFTDEYRKLLLGKDNGPVTMTEENSGYLLNLFWALGLSNKNPILEKGEMSDPKYGGAGSFASTGGWTVSKGKPMDHFSRHSFVTLTKAQQTLVDKVSKGIYRPCCGNSTHFPDCNHGMAMLGLLELMASQGVSEADMWKTALAVNSYWFPDTYVTIATYLKDRGVEWNDVDPKEILGSSYSSSQGYARIASQVEQPQQQGGGGSACGGEGAEPAAQQRSQGGCGI
ncbi:MAG: hypothetical protein UY74_C0061G0009 [Candidatus Kaiserbacteria bacterium GW2011_GWC2_52_8b]|uniref:Uncharacterized protein n=2 Tax=Candidatus Kaiseribacteriota TaxID=1752734 RepID=A0A0G2ABU1_9BACT|nr:MAG: hypothetical protein UY67_C0017G0018 [Candidatus Kaiserbacteria bacterium GW2011_GWA2_52_12]KKW29869.1 MAG: hypothetical protein UY74_C0061G0009 [Candidatus Kaiserbacteria bacterium GW2011_GWC2_52_8b]